jgi:hypothetical protein
MLYTWHTFHGWDTDLMQNSREAKIASSVFFALLEGRRCILMGAGQVAKGRHCRPTELPMQHNVRGVWTKEQ